jgi:hypothetical protein
MPPRIPANRTAAAVPAELSGKWIAWSADHSHIVAHSDMMPDLWRQVRNQRVADPIFEKVPRSDVRFVGMQ